MVKHPKLKIYKDLQLIEMLRAALCQSHSCEEIECSECIYRRAAKTPPGTIKQEFIELFTTLAEKEDESTDR
jgi:hypothetical protein